MLAFLEPVLGVRILPVRRDLGIPAAAVHLDRFGERSVRAEPDDPEPAGRCLLFQPGQQPSAHAQPPRPGGHPHVPYLPGPGLKGTQPPAADRATVLVGDQEYSRVA